MNEIYEVKVQAASLSIFNPTKLQIGESMIPRKVKGTTKFLRWFWHFLLSFLDWSTAELRVYRSVAAKRNSIPDRRFRDYRDHWCKLFRFNDSCSCCCYVAVSSNRFARLKPLKLWLGEHETHESYGNDNEEKKSFAVDKLRSWLFNFSSFARTLIWRGFVKRVYCKVDNAKIYSHICIRTTKATFVRVMNKETF